MNGIEELQYILERRPSSEDLKLDEDTVKKNLQEYLMLAFSEFPEMDSFGWVQGCFFNDEDTNFNVYSWSRELFINEFNVEWIVNGYENGHWKKDLHDKYDELSEKLEKYIWEIDDRYFGILFGIRPDTDNYEGGFRITIYKDGRVEKEEQNEGPYR